jgi:ElaB/YqjD/DUF883 family membrane-anchored ribosome-binding protein
MTSQRNDLSSRDYEREAEATRYRLAESLDELGERLTPGQVFDEVLTYARGGSGVFFRALTNAARENPIPSLLIGAGCMMFLSEKTGLSRVLGHNFGSTPEGVYRVGRNGRSMGARASGAMSDAASAASSATSRAASTVTDAAGNVVDSAGNIVQTAAERAAAAAQSVRSGVRSATDYAGEQASNMAGGVKRGVGAVGETVSSASQSVRQTAHDVRDQVAGAAGQLRQTAGQVGSKMGEYSAAAGEQVSAMAEQVAQTADRTRQQASRAARQVKQKATSAIYEQPLLFAAIGLAVGAAIAAALPSTETEDEWMGDTSDSVKDTVSEVASNQFEAAKAAAGNVLQEAKGAVEKQGLTASAAAELARNMGDKIKEVVSDTSAAGKAELRDFAKMGDKT